ncbi:MAG: EAL domain-containing protein [Chromatiaceae bacterium]
MKLQLSPWIALAVGLVLTMVASLEVKKAHEQEAANEFAVTSDQVTLKIQARLNAYALILKGGAGFFAASHAVDRREWQAYVEKLRVQDSVPGVQGIGFSQVIPPQQLAAHIASMRAEGFPDYRVHPAGERDLYTSIIFLEPFRGRNLRAFGFDMFSEPVRRAAMEQARDSGAPALSGKVGLVQEPGQEVQAGTVMYVPVYRHGAPTDTVEQRRAALIGWAYSSYRMQDLLEGILANGDDPSTKRVHLHLYAGHEVMAANELYDSHPAVTHKVDPLSYQQRTLEFNGQHWLLAFHAGEGHGAISYASAWATLAGGIVLSSLLCGLMLALARTQVRARAIADTLTAALATSRGLLQKIIDTAPIRVFWKDRDCRYLGCNPLFARDAGMKAPSDLIGLDDYAMGWAAQADLYRADDRQVMASGQSRLDFEEPQTTPDGKPLWLRTSKVPLRDAAGNVIGVLGIYDDITERKQTEIALLSEKQFSEDALNALPGVFYMFDVTGRFLRWNHHFSKVSGYTDAELATMRGTDFFTGDDQRRVGEAMQRVFVQGQAEVEADIQTKDGRKLPHHLQGQRSTIADQIYLLGVGLDVSEQRRTRQALEIERTHLHTLVSTIPDLIWLKAVDGTYLACNPEFERFVGAAESDILGKTDYDFVPSALADSFREHDRAAIAAGKTSRNEEWVTYASDGRRVLLETTKMPMRTPDGRLVGVLGIGHDITERKSHQDQLEHLAHFDTLTGLPNRVLLADRLHQAMLQARRRETLLAIAFLDLDGFKAINDQYGHPAGDQLLTTLASHMKQVLREGDTLARIGGDEFLAVFIDLPDVESSAPLLARLLAVAAAVVDYEGHALRVSASLGVTFYPQAEAIDADQLLRQADQAMYQAKQAGKNRYHIFDTEQDRHVRGHHESLKRIRRALDEREFVLYYQPKVNMRSGVVIGAEALIRWQHPERGLLPPAAFLPLIADHPLAIAIGEWVLETAMRQIETWKAAGLPLPVSVNIDAIQLEQADFVQRLRQQVAAHPGLAAGDLELEVLETSALQNTAYATGVILACREMGVGFALDDFGTGYSSLTYLKRLPVGLLKIDQSFVRDMLDDPDDLAILSGILGLATAFRSQTIAEGVETLVHGKILLQLGCELAQGYAIARPMPAEDLPVWLAAWRPPASWLNQAPIRRDDLPILFAWVEHRAWILQVVSFIRGEGDTPPQMHPEQCRVGQWLKAEARLPKEHHLAVEALGPYHIEIHELASELIRLKQDGRMDAAMAKLSELDRLRERFLARIMEMLPDMSADPECVNPSPA